MKRRCVSLLLIATILISMTPTASAVGRTGTQKNSFMLPVAVELPEKQPSGLMIDNDKIVLPDVGKIDFIGNLSGEMPSIRADGFLAEPSAPLKVFPKPGKLLAEVSTPDETATPIGTAEELASIVTDGNYVLTADIDLSASNWTPIDNVSNITLDGQGHVISGMTIDGTHYAGGLFGRAEHITIRNLVMSAPTFINARQYAGILIGYADGDITIENCSAEQITTRAAQTFGGLIGYLYDNESTLTMRDCAVDISLSDNYASGALISSAQAKSVSFTDCIVKVDFSGNGNGLASSVTCREDFSMLRCAVTGEIGNSSLSNSAGMIRRVNAPSCHVTDCVFDGTISYPVEITNYTGYSGGGFFGELVANTAIFSNCRASGAIQNAAASTGGGIAAFVGEALTSGERSISFSNCLADMDITATLNGTTASYIGGLMGISPKSFYAAGCLNTGNLTAVTTTKNCLYIGGLLGSATSPTTTQFLLCENRGNVTSQTDAGGIVSSGVGFLFKDCKNAGMISTSAAAGGILGNGDGTLSNCVNTGNMAGSYVGGMIGRGNKSTFYNCRANFSAALTPTSNAAYSGGMIGYASLCDYSDCAVNMAVKLPAQTGSVPSNFIGGLSGKGGGAAERCAVKLRPSGSQSYLTYIGGLFASTDSASDISDSTADLAVSGISTSSTFYAGGLVAYANSPLAVDNCAATFSAETPSSATVYAGGILGDTFSIALISNSYVTGSIDMRPDVYGAAQGYAGGLIGNMRSGSSLLSIERCWTDVDISGANAMGGLVGSSYNTTAVITSSWADGTLSLQDVLPLLTADDVSASSYLGGLVGYNNSVYQTGASSNMVIQDCYFDGQIECADAQYTGGIIGRGGSLIHNCYSTEDITATINPGTLGRTRGIGGLAGSTGKISHCRYDSTVTVPCEQKASNAHDFAGAIAGHGNAQNCQSTSSVRGYNAGGIVGSGNASDCTFNGSVLAVGYAGGITAQGGAENCSSSGYVQGCTVGGIAGFGGDHIIGCTSDCALYLHAQCSDAAHYIGGIAGQTTSYDIYDSHYMRHLQVTFTDPSGYESTFLFVGGIIGDAASVNRESYIISGCTSKGVTVYSHRVRQLAIGGIAGEFSTGIIDNCRTDGNIYVRGWGESTPNSRNYESLYAGGLFGYGADVRIANSIINGDISVNYVPSDTSKRYAVIEDGRMVGYCTTLTVENCQFNGIFTPAPRLPSDSYSSISTSIAGRCPTLKYADVPDVNAPEKPVEGYRVKVLSQDLNSNLSPMEGITVYANDTVVGTTDAEGQVTFDSDTFSSYPVVWLSASADGYFECRNCTYLADGGAYMLILKEKSPGVIYFNSAVMSGEEIGTADLLSYLTSLKIDILDTTAYTLTVDIDWNDLDESGRTVALVNENRTHTIYLNSSETTSVTLPNTFDVGEDIYLYASGTKDGEPIAKEELLNVSVITTDVNFETEEGNMDVGGSGDKDDNKHLYFLKGLNLNIDFDDLADFASAVTYKNGTLTVKYDVRDKQERSVSVWSKFSEHVAVGGEVSIPISNLNEGEWAGKVNFSIGEEVETDVSNKSIREENEKHLKKDEFDQATHTYDFLIGGVPCFLETGLKVGGSASFGIHGPRGNVYVDGDLTFKGGGSIFAGIGGEVSREVELKVGGEGTLDATIPGTMDTASEITVTLDPRLEGNLNAKVSVKAFIVELEAALRLGGFVWNKHGAEWTWLGEEPTPGIEPSMYSLQNAHLSSMWVPLNRDYLSEGGGFLSQNTSLFGFNTASNQSLRYENIAELTETAMSTESGQSVLYFTADDGVGSGGNITNHTVLYRTVQQTDGSWSAPMSVSSTANGYPSSPYADGSFVVWTESSDVGSLDEMLQSTRICVAKNGQLVHTIETEGYVYAPKVSAGSDGTSAVVSWLSDPTVSSENLLGGDPKLYYASFFNSEWSTAQEIRTTGIPQNAAPMCGSGKSSSYIYYVNDAGAYLYTSLSNSTYTQANVPAGRTVLWRNMAAVFEENNTLTLYNGSSSTTKTVNYNGTAAPVYAYDGSVYSLFWPEDNGIRLITSSNGYAWSDPILLTGLSGTTAELSAAMTNGTPTIAYTQNAGSLTHLYTASIDTDGIDMVLSELKYDPRDMMERNYIIFNGTLYNNGMGNADGFTVTVTDETGVQVFTRTYTTPVASGNTETFNAAFAPDGLSEHTYTFAVIPSAAGSTVADSDVSDNTLDISVGQPSAEVVDANFQQTPEGSIQLCAMVRNTGAALLNGVTVKVTTADGKPVLTQQYIGDKAIPYGSIRQILLENALPNTYYQVSVLYNGEVLDSTMLMYEDTVTKLLLPSNVSISGSTAQMSLFGQNQTSASSKIVLAMYDGAKMVAVGTQSTSTLNGNQDLEFSLSDVLKPGEYNYKLFFLSDSGTLAPISCAVSGTINVD